MDIKTMYLCDIEKLEFEKLTNEELEQIEDRVEDINFNIKMIDVWDNECFEISNKCSEILSRIREIRRKKINEF